MTKLTFDAFIRKFLGDDNLLGDFAGDWDASKDNREITSPHQLHHYLDGKNSCGEAKRVAFELYESWRRIRRSGGCPPK